MSTYFYNKVFFIAAFSLIVLVTAGFQSCKKDNIGGSPVIERVRVTDPVKKDSVFEKAFPGTFLVIEGKNLANAQQVLFNDFPAYFNPAYNTDTHIFVKVPSETPTPDFATVPNTIKVVTATGQATYSFTVNPPPPLIIGVSNENPMDGDVVVISGMYLRSVSELILPGNIKVTNFNKNSDGTIITFTTPVGMKDVAASGKIELVSSMSGNAKSIFEMNKRTGEGMITNNDDINFYLYPQPPSQESNPAMYPNAYGKYLRIAGNNTPGNSILFWERYRAGNYGANIKVLEDPTTRSVKAENYALKFEVNTLLPTKPEYIVRFSFNEKYSFTFEPHLESPGLVFHTGNKWITYTVPLNRFRIAKNEYGDFIPDGANMATLGDIVTATGTINNFYVRTRTLYNVPLVGSVDYAFDNFRIVKIK